MYWIINYALKLKTKYNKNRKYNNTIKFVHVWNYVIWWQNKTLILQATFISRLHINFHRLTGNILYGHFFSNVYCESLLSKYIANGRLYSISPQNMIYERCPFRMPWKTNMCFSYFKMVITNNCTKLENLWNWWMRQSIYDCWIK